MGNANGVHHAEEPPTLETEQSRETLEANAAGIWQRMLEHAIEASAVDPLDDAK